MNFGDFMKNKQGKKEPEKKKGNHPFGHSAIDQKDGPCKACMSMVRMNE